jgi:hypothetical protein
VVTLSSGSIWEIQFSYEYLYEYYPSVIVCPATRKLIIKGKSLSVLQIREGTQASLREAGSEPAVIESRIDGDFEGWDYEAIFKLQNGQMWMQTSSRYRYRYKFSPGVVIVKIGNEYQMQVDGMDERVTVRRLR